MGGFHSIYESNWDILSKKINMMEGGGRGVCKNMSGGGNIELFLLSREGGPKVV